VTVCLTVKILKQGEGTKNTLIFKGSKPSCCMSTTCKNCHFEYDGKYCPSCGQKADTERITYHSLAHEIPHSLLHIDKGIFFTMKELFTRPAASLREYMSGRRVKHFKPLAYVLILTAISSFVTHLVDSHIISKGLGTTLSLEPTLLNRVLLNTSHFFDKYPSVFYFLMIPVISLLSWLFFRRSGYNYWENVILNTYLTAQFNLLLIVAQVMRLFNDGAVSYTPFLIVYFTYLGFVYGMFFRHPRSKRTTHTLATLGLIASVVLVYVTGLSFAGMMSPWWGV
jgi:hypothetical protein